MDLNLVVLRIGSGGLDLGSSVELDVCRNPVRGSLLALCWNKQDVINTVSVRGVLRASPGPLRKPSCVFDTAPSLSSSLVS